jgi:hypothetical protein
MLDLVVHAVTIVTQKVRMTGPEYERKCALPTLSSYPLSRLQRLEKSTKLTAQQASFWLEISIRSRQMQKHEHLTVNFVCSIIQKLEYGVNEAISRILQHFIPLLNLRLQKVSKEKYQAIFT